jgi:hypothetical protein
MKTAVGFLIALATLALPAIAQAQIPATNAPGTASASTNVEPARAGQIAPLIEMHDVPINTAIQRLARDTGVNYMIAPEITQKWIDSGEPVINFKLKNAVAKDVLTKMLNFRHLALVEDPVSNIALIIPAGEVTDPLFDGLETNTASLHTNLIPLIQFVDVPITTAIENLARQEDVNYQLDPNLSELWEGPAPNHIPEPSVTIRLENVTAWATLNRLLNIHNLVLAEDPVTRIGRITFSDELLPVIDTTLLDMETSSSNSSASMNIPLIQFADVPLDTALENLIRQCDANIELAPELKDGSYWQNRTPELSVRWTNVTAWQAVVALCENYDLVIIKNDATGRIQIKPKAAARHHHLQLK